MYQERSASSERPTMFEAIIDEETPLFRDSIVNFSTADDAPVRPSLRPLGRAMTEVTGQRLTLVQLRKNSLPLPSLRRPSGIEIDGHKLRHDLDRMKYLQMGLGLEPEPLQPLLPVAKEGYGTTTRRDESASPLSHKTGKSTDIPHSKFRAGVSNTKFCLVFGVIMAGYFVACFDATLMASSHPVITSYFHASNSASWLSTVFLLTSTAFQPLFGRVSDTIGRRPVYVFNLTVFGLTILWCALADSIGSFIAARAVCGIGAGGILSMGMIITSDLVPIENRGIYQSYINLAFGLGSAAGAALGGLLCDTLGWQLTFGVQVPLIFICCVTAWFTTPTTLGPNLRSKSGKTIWETVRSFDITGSFLLTMAVTFLILGINLGGNVLSWDHPIVIASLIAFSIFSALLLRVESRAIRPIMPLKLLTSQPRANLIFNNFFGNIAANTILFNVPLYFQAVRLESATNSGLRLAMPAIAVTVAGVSTGFIITWSRRLTPTLFLGSVLFLVGSICMTSFWPGMPAWASLVFLIPAGLGQGFAFPSTIMSVLAVSSDEDQAVATTTLVLWRSLGGVMGVSLSSLVLQNALVVYLNRLVTGDDKAMIIHEVRKSVQAILELGPAHRQQVISAYSHALQWTFASAVVTSVILVLITIPVKLPRLAKRL